MTTDLAPELTPSRALAPENRVSTMLLFAEEFSAAAFHELSTARQLATAAAGRPYPLANNMDDKDAEKRRAQIRAAWKSAVDNVKVAMEIVRFVKEFEPNGPQQPDAPPDPATQQLLDREKDREAREVEARRKRVEERLASAAAMSQEIPPLFG